MTSAADTQRAHARPKAGSPAARITGAFNRASMGPIEYAASCIVGNRIEQGLAELEPRALFEAYQRGVGDVARLAGVTPAEVERSLPSASIHAAQGRIAASYPRAIEAWRLHAGEFGFLDAVTQLTVDGRRPDIASVLTRVAGKVRHDRELAAPLNVLGADVAAWVEALDACRTALEDGGWLVALLRKRTLIRMAFGVVSTSILIAITVSVVALRFRRDTIDRLLASPDACSAETFTEAQLSWSTKAQRDKVATMRASCDAARKEKAAAEEAERQRLELERAAKAKKDAREAECKALADDVAAGALSQKASTTAGASAELLDRVAKKSLAAGDLGPKDPVFPCQDSEAATRFTPLFEAALLADSTLWTRLSNPSPLVEKTLVAHKESFAPMALIGFADGAERLARAGLTRGDEEQITRAARLCSIARALGVPGHAACATLEKR